MEDTVNFDHYYDTINDLHPEVVRYFGTDFDSNELTYKIIVRAFDKDYTKEQKLKNIDEYLVFREYLKASKEVAYSFHRLRSNIYKQYLKMLHRGMDALVLLLNYKGLDICCNFYDQEVLIAKQIIKEYKSYLRQGHYLEALNGEDRKEEEK